MNSQTLAIIEALGSKQNITLVEACITRLRVSVKDVNSINKQSLKDLGALDIVDVNNGIQIIFGTKSQQYRDEINQILA
ncbi:hypothetical protein A1D22_01385 [Pasteurellaceae bacterium LFhippo2]|nr:hypothetical protein [Pasteurellaceae bacterium LFhippo2]